MGQAKATLSERSTSPPCQPAFLVGRTWAEAAFSERSTSPPNQPVLKNAPTRTHTQIQTPTQTPDTMHEYREAPKAQAKCKHDISNAGSRFVARLQDQGKQGDTQHPEHMSRAQSKALQRRALHILQMTCSQPRTCQPICLSHAAYSARLLVRVCTSCPQTHYGFIHTCDSFTRADGNCLCASPVAGTEANRSMWLQKDLLPGLKHCPATLCRFHASRPRA